MALVGGGNIPQPGEISLAHNGVLFLDELPEFNRSTLEVLRQPMEDRKVTIGRAKLSLEFPSAFILVASMNPCPCGYYNHPDKECTCPPGAVAKYLKPDFRAIAGQDRSARRSSAGTLIPDCRTAGLAESSGDIRQRVMMARKIQRRRFTGGPSQRGIYCNAQINGRLLQHYCRIDAASAQLLRAAMDNLKLSARAHDHILKISRTIADLSVSDHIHPEHIAEAIQFRSLDRDGWAG